MQSNGDQSETNLSTRRLGQRYTVQEAADILGTTVDGVRSRIRRGTLDSMKVAGTVFVLIDQADQSGPVEASPDESGTSLDQLADALLEAKDETISELREQVGYLRGQLDTRAEELRRKDHIIAALADRIPELEPAKEAPPEPRESSVIASEERGRGDVPPEPRGEEEGPETVSAASTEEGEGVETPLRQEHRSWWRRLFGP